MAIERRSAFPTPQELAEREANESAPTPIDENPDRLLPQSPENEKAVLGCILLKPELCSDIIAVNTFGDELFYDLKHWLIFENVVALMDTTGFCDLITLRERLLQRNQLESIGGMAFLAGLTNFVPSAENLEYYLNIVLDAALKRKIIRTCAESIEMAFNPAGTGAEIADAVETKLLGLRQTKRVVESQQESVDRILTEIENEYQGIERPGLLKTGFADIDEATGGLFPEDFFVIAGRPGMGKSTLAMNIVEKVSIDQRIPSLYFTLEMSKGKINRRSLASQARVDLRTFRTEPGQTPRPMANQFSKVSAAAGSLSTAPIQIEYIPGINILTLRSIARKAVRETGARLIVVDMIQLVEGTRERRGGNRTQEVDEVSRSLKALAGELQVIIIGVSAMNRGVESDNRRPRLSDLREAGGIESDADVVAFLWSKDPTDANSFSQPVELYFAKTRSGSGGEFNFLFFKRWSRFEPPAKLPDADI